MGLELALSAWESRILRLFEKRVLKRRKLQNLKVIICAVKRDEVQIV
jgi:hypothetical protein